MAWLKAVHRGIPFLTEPSPLFDSLCLAALDAGVLFVGPLAPSPCNSRVPGGAACILSSWCRPRVVGAGYGRLLPDQFACVTNLPICSKTPCACRSIACSIRRCRRSCASLVA
eukprot:365338-Chlamydomonas_euryale.AAC.16